MMTTPFEDREAAEGDRVTADAIPSAVTARQLVYDDGSTQTFTPDGLTVYAENGRTTR